MKIITKSYKSTTGYHDSLEGVSPFDLLVHTLDDGREVAGPSSNIPIQLNEIQISGDSELRLKYVGKEDKGELLLLANPNYEKLFIRRQLLSTKDLPLSLDDSFVRRWGALAFADANVISKGRESGKDHFAGGNWGTIHSIEEKKGMLKHIKEMPVKIRKELNQVENVEQFSADYIIWRDTLKGQPITYKK